MNSRVFIILLSAILFASDHSVARERSNTRVRPKLTEQGIRTEKRLYRRSSEGDLFLHFYFPADWKQQDARPAIVFLFGRGPPPAMIWTSKLVLTDHAGSPHGRRYRKLLMSLSA